MFESMKFQSNFRVPFMCFLCKNGLFGLPWSEQRALVLMPWGARASDELGRSSPEKAVRLYVRSCECAVQMLLDLLRVGAR
jgi:hypothetical protein